MRHFATESGKSKGQFYIPAEVIRVIARVIGISPANTKASITAFTTPPAAPALEAVWRHRPDCTLRRCSVTR
jgi:type I restriction-modification system DNA methylase subunit